MYLKSMETRMRDFGKIYIVLGHFMYCVWKKIYVHTMPNVLSYYVYVARKKHSSVKEAVICLNLNVVTCINTSSFFYLTHKVYFLENGAKLAAILINQLFFLFDTNKHVCIFLKQKLTS